MKIWLSKWDSGNKGGWLVEIQICFSSMALFLPSNFYQTANQLMAAAVTLTVKNKTFISSYFSQI